MSTTKLIATYARVSTARQEEEGTIETQISKLEEFAKEKNHTIVKRYIDNGWSGDVLARPSLDQLRGDARKKVWEAVLIYDPDRLARRYSFQELVMDELKEAGIEVIFVTVSTPKNGEEKILHGVRGLFAEYERTKIAERFRLGKMRKIKENHILLTEAPYGYDYTPKKEKIHGYLSINEMEAAVVKMIFNWVEEGLTIRGVVKNLHGRRIRPRKSQKGVWATSTISHLLRNTTYIGEPVYGKSYATIPEIPQKNEKYKKIKKTSRKIRPKEEWNTMLQPSIAIIDRGQFERVQERLGYNQRMAKRNRRYQYLFAGLIWCACGSRRTGEGRQEGNKQHLYYRCSGRVKTFPLPRTCKECGLNVRLADEKIWEKLEKLMTSPDLLARQLDRWSNNQEKKFDNSGTQVEELEREIKKIHKERDRYSRAYGESFISMEQLGVYTKELNERILSIEKQMDFLKSKQSEMGNNSCPTKEEILAFTQESSILRELNFEAKQAIVRNVVDKVITNGIEITVNGFLPINSYVKFQTIDRHCGSSERGEIHPLQDPH